MCVCGKRPSAWPGSVGGKHHARPGASGAFSTLSNQPCCPLQVGYTYLEDPAYKLYKDHPDVQAFEVCRRL